MKSCLRGLLFPTHYLRVHKFILVFMDSAYADGNATVQPKDKVAVATDADDVTLNAGEIAGEHTDKGLVLDNLGKQTVQDADTVGRSVKGAHERNHTRMGDAGDTG